MRNLIFIVVGLWLVHLCCVQAELNIVLLDIDAPVQNPEYITDFEGYMSDDEDPQVICNFTIIKELPQGCKGHLILKGASMGEFVISTGIDYEMDFCEMFDEPIIMGRLLRMLGFKKENCPPIPGVYGSEGFQLDTDTLPDEFPSNNYLAIFEIVDENDEELMVMHLYLRIY
ncbi:uncharacterized protein [Chelonus insularis]|uniref:uncharacterized protein n=1 Tax=Chelonus insularis TaxID=460826 RepID=UPI00158F20BF|nr:uncharacterized protein LOC118068189 [Chelonus insularis]